MDKPGVSIVVATKGRVRLLDELLDSLEPAIGNAECPCEIILVDDSEGDDAQDIQKVAQRHNAQVITYGPSVSAKRNVGAEASTYDIVLFLDSDCLATPNLVVEHYKCYEDQGVGAVAGLLEFVGEDTWFWKVVEASPFVMWFSFPKFMPTVPWTPTANCSMRKDIFLEIGEFDVGFPNKPGGEDVDLGLRFQKTGKAMKCNPDALVYHQKETWQQPKAMMRRLWNYGCADSYLMDRHPDILFPAFPRKTLLYALLLALSLVLAFVATPFAPLVCLAVIVADLFASALIINGYENRGVTVLQQAVIQLLLINNEAGFIWRCLTRKKYSYISKQLIYLDGQAYGTADRACLLSVVHSVAFAVFAFAVALL